MDFLTFEGMEAVDRALLTSKDKFLARVALYSLQALRQIAQNTGQAIEEISPQQVLSWVEQDDTLLQQAEDQEAFQMFFTQLVMSSLKPLTKIAQDEGMAIANLTNPQIIHWFEQDAKSRLEQS